MATPLDYVTAGGTLLTGIGAMITARRQGATKGEVENTQRALYETAKVATDTNEKVSEVHEATVDESGDQQEHHNSPQDQANKEGKG